MINKDKSNNSTILDYFKKLFSDKQKVRLNANIALLKYINDNSVENEQERNYCLQRLIRGLGSSKSRVRSAYYIALTTLLSTNTSIPIETLLGIVEKQLHAGGSSAKSEQADCFMGKILTCGAIIKSDYFLTISKEKQRQVLEMLVNAGKKRSYLPLLSYTFLVELLDKIGEETFIEILWPVLSLDLEKPLNEQTLDSLYFILTAKEKFPNFLSKKFIKDKWNIPDLVHEDSVPVLCQILLNVPMLTSIDHPVYKVMSEQIVYNNIVREWCQEMDKLIEQPKRNMYLVIIIFLTLITQQLTDASHIPHMLQNNFLGVAIRTFKNTKVRDKDDQFLNKMDVFFNVLKTKLQSPEIKTKTKINVLKKLLFYPGDLMFEQITKCKLPQQISLSLDSDGVKKLVDMYMNVVLETKPKVVEGNESTKWLNNERLYCAHMVVKLLGHNSVKSEIDWRMEKMKVFLKLGLFRDANQVLSKDLAASIKDCFFHTLDQKFQNLEEARHVLSSLLHFIDENVFADENKYFLQKPFTSSEIEVWKELMKLISKLENQKKTKHSFAIPVFHTLCLHMGLYLFREFKMAESVLKELSLCFERLKPRKSRKDSTKERDENEPLWTEVLIDLFLSLLSQESHLLRTVVKCVFPHICPLLTVTNIHQILDVLNPKNDENILSRSKGTGMEESSESESEDDSDENEDDSSKEDDAENEKDSSEDENESDMENEDEGNEKLTDKVRTAVREALHKTGYQTDDESEDLDGMDEDEGKRLNKALEDAFKLLAQRKVNKRKQTKEQKVLLYFRVRVIDLIDMYLDVKPAALQCLEIVQVLIQTLEFSIKNPHQKPLFNRLRSCFKKFRMIKKFESIEGVSDDLLVEIFSKIVEKGSRTTFVYKDMSDIISHISVFVIRCSQAISSSKKSERHSKLSKLLTTYLEQFLKNRDCVIPFLLFKNVLLISWDGNWNMVSHLMELAFDNDVKIYKQSIVLELLSLFYTHCKERISNIEKFKKKFSSSEAKFSSNTIEFFKSLLSSSEENKIQEKFINYLILLLKDLKTSNLTEHMDWDSIAQVIQEYRKNEHFTKSAKGSYSKLCHALGIQHITNLKLNGVKKESNKTVQSNSDKTENEKTSNKRKRKKAKNMHEKRKLKKEANLLRLQANSEGMSDFAFNKLDLENVNVSDNESTNDEPYGKKRKINNENKKE